MSIMFSILYPKGNQCVREHHYEQGIRARITTKFYSARFINIVANRTGLSFKLWQLCLAIRKLGIEEYMTCKGGN